MRKIFESLEGYLYDAHQDEGYLLIRVSTANEALEQDKLHYEAERDMRMEIDANLAKAEEVLKELDKYLTDNDLPNPAHYYFKDKK